jgi:hypothetical protein
LESTPEIVNRRFALEVTPVAEEAGGGEEGQGRTYFGFDEGDKEGDNGGEDTPRITKFSDWLGPALHPELYLEFEFPIESVKGHVLHLHEQGFNQRRMNRWEKRKSVHDMSEEAIETKTRYGHGEIPLALLRETAGGFVQAQLQLMLDGPSLGEESSRQSHSVRGPGVVAEKSEEDSLKRGALLMELMLAPVFPEAELITGHQSAHDPPGQLCVALRCDSAEELSVTVIAARDLCSQDHTGILCDPYILSSICCLLSVNFCLFV